MSNSGETIDKPQDVIDTYSVPDWWPAKGEKSATKPAHTRWHPLADFTRHITKQFDMGRFIILLAASYALGIIAFFKVSQNPNIVASLSVCLVLISLTTLTRYSLARARLFMLLVALSIGFAAPQIKATLAGTSMLAEEITLPLTGKINAITTSSSGRKTIFLSDLSTSYRLREPLPRIARLTVLNSTTDLDFSIGDRIRLFTRLTPVPKPVLPHSYDSQIQSYFKGIGAFGLVFGEVNLVQAAPTRTFKAKLATLRTVITASIHQALPGDSGAVATAMLVGDQSGISSDIRKKMQVSGLAHILAISGLHMSLVAGGVYVVLRALFATSHALTLRLNTRMLAALLAIPTAFAYLAISGAGIATLRSTIMATIVFIAILAGRRALTMRNVAIAAILVLILYPQSILSAGFQLSFAAVIGLVGVYEMYRQKTNQENGRGDSPTRKRPAKIIRYSFGLLLSSLTAGLATSIFAAYHFNQLSPLGIFANLLGMPLVAFLIMPAGIAAFLTMPFGFADLPLKLMGWSIDRLLDIATFFAAKTAQFAYIAPLDQTIFLITTLALVWFAFFQSRLRWLAPIIAFAAIPILGKAPMPDLIISDRGTSAAIMGDNGLQMIASRRKSFPLNRWSETYNTDLNKAPTLGKCDQQACVYTAPQGYTVAVVKKRAAFSEECRTADIIISKLEAPKGCIAKTHLADGPFLTESGTTLAYWNTTKRTFSITAAINDQQRIWRPTYNIRTTQ